MSFIEVPFDNSTQVISTHRRRTGLSAFERTSLRKYAKKNPLLTQKQLQDWFKCEFKRAVTQPTISDSLSSRYAFLDDSNLPTSLFKKRFRNAKYPELERTLNQWIQDNKTDKNITGDLIKQQAVTLWKSSPRYQDKEMPVFSNGWLQRFKQRHGIRTRVAIHDTQRRTLQPIEEQSYTMTGISSRLTPVAQPFPTSNDNTNAGNYNFNQPIEQLDPPPPEDFNDSVHHKPKVSAQDALEALGQLRLHELHQKDRRPEFIELLNRYEVLIMRRRNETGN